MGMCMVLEHHLLNIMSFSLPLLRETYHHFELVCFQSELPELNMVFWKQWSLMEDELEFTMQKMSR